MQTRSFVMLLVGASTATFAAVFLATSSPKAFAVARPAIDASVGTAAVPPPDRFEMPESVKPEPHPAMAGMNRRVAAPKSGSRVETSVYYPGCNQVRAAGKAPLYRGQPGYRSGMDGDNDGIACEDYR